MSYVYTHHTCEVCCKCGNNAWKHEWIFFVLQFRKDCGSKKMVCVCIHTTRGWIAKIVFPCYFSFSFVQAMLMTLVLIMLWGNHLHPQSLFLIWVYLIHICFLSKKCLFLASMELKSTTGVTHCSQTTFSQNSVIPRTQRHRREQGNPTVAVLRYLPLHWKGAWFLLTGLFSQLGNGSTAHGVGNIDYYSSGTRHTWLDCKL